MVTTTLGRVVLTFSGIALDRAGRLSQHDHRQAQIRERAVHQLPQQIARPLYERARHRRLRCRAGIGLDLWADRFLPATLLTGRDAGQRPLQDDVPQLVMRGEVIVARKRHLRLAVHSPRSRPLDRHPSAAPSTASSLIASATGTV